jgi:PiT family inorganic phosphate transporter
VTLPAAVAASAVVRGGTLGTVLIAAAAAAVIVLLARRHPVGADNVNDPVDVPGRAVAVEAGA